jgi:opacity protein-like surface antigen
MITKSLALFTALLLAAAPALAQSRARKSEFYISPVFTQGQDYSSEGGTSIKTDTGYGFGLGFAYNVNANVSWGIEGAWSSSDYRSNVQTSTGTPVNVNGYVDSSTIRFLGTYNLFESPFTPFVTGGLGWTYIDTNVPSGPPQGVCWWYPWWGEVCSTYVPTHSTTKFSYNVALGLRQDFQQMFIRGLVSNQWVDIGSAGTTSWTQYRVDIGWRF